MPDTDLRDLDGSSIRNVERPLVNVSAARKTMISFKDSMVDARLSAIKDIRVPRLEIGSLAVQSYEYSMQLSSGKANNHH
jgi:hypothetical protein